MLLNEEEAKKKTCPVLVIALQIRTLAAVQAKNAFEGDAFCIASECMMFRGELTREEAENGFTPERGFCGLAGRT